MQRTLGASQARGQGEAEEARARGVVVIATQIFALVGVFLIGAIVGGLLTTKYLYWAVNVMTVDEISVERCTNVTCTEQHLELRGHHALDRAFSLHFRVTPEAMVLGKRLDDHGSHVDTPPLPAGRYKTIAPLVVTKDPRHFHAHRPGPVEVRPDGSFVLAGKIVGHAERGPVVAVLGMLAIGDVVETTGEAFGDRSCDGHGRCNYFVRIFRPMAGWVEAEGLVTTSTAPPLEVDEP